MCWKWFLNLFHADPVVYSESNKILLTFAINDYPGTANDLNGCLNDQANVIEHLPDFQLRAFSDADVTRECFINQCRQAVAEAQPGTNIVIHYSGHGTQVRDRNGDEPDGYDEAIYLYDGSLIDDDINTVLQGIPDGVTVCILLDSCFSGTATRNPHRSRFIQTEKKKLRKLRKTFLRETDLKWVVISGCGENQTSADALIGGKWNGAFTYYAMKALDRTFTYRQWFDKIRTYLPNANYDQAPTIEGPDVILKKQIFT